ncbi:MAG TPA: hypothetical protein VHX38_37140 [Pseudonocardiaceae bacterium]|nr:hypothetical protein [Pseudonocardiaceae bacterium]
MTHRTAARGFVELIKIGGEFLGCHIRQHQQCLSAFAMRLEPSSANCPPQGLGEPHDAQSDTRVGNSMHLRSEDLRERLATRQIQRVEYRRMSVAGSLSIDGSDPTAHHQ